MGAVSVTIAATDVMGNKRVHHGTGAMSASYATGGDTFTARQFGMTSVDRLIVNNTEGGFMLAPNLDALTVFAYEAGADGAALDEVTATGDLSAELFDWVAYGV